MTAARLVVCISRMNALTNSSFVFFMIFFKSRSSCSTPYSHWSSQSEPSFPPRWMFIPPIVASTWRQNDVSASLNECPLPSVYFDGGAMFAVSIIVYLSMCHALFSNSCHRVRSLFPVLTTYSARTGDPRWFGRNQKFNYDTL